MVSVACESHRTQKENRRGALVKLAALVREAWRPPKVRRQRTGISTATKRERREGKRRAALKTLFDELRAFEGEGHHVTLTYFWVAIVTAAAARAADAPSFAELYRRPTSSAMRNPDLVYKHYSQRLLDFDPANAAASQETQWRAEGKPAPRLEFVPPNLKPIPSVVG